MPKLRRRSPSGGDALPIVASLPTKVRELYESSWKSTARTRTPHVDARGSQRSRGYQREVVADEFGWDQSLLLETAATLKSWIAVELADLKRDLVEMSSAYAWACTIETWLRQFHEPTQRSIAWEHGRETFDADLDLRPYFEALIVGIDLRTTRRASPPCTLDRCPSSRRVHRPIRTLAARGETHLL